MENETDAASTQLTQILLRLHYQELVRRGAPLPPFAEVEFQCHSQNGEDGLLLYLFSLIQPTTRRVVELCAGDGIECNAANLILNHRWHGLLVDGNADLIARGQAFYATDRRTRFAPPTFVQAWVTAETVDALVQQHGFAGPIDLLSLDLDGNDYWVWRALEAITPQVVILEFNALCGPDRRVSMAYDPAYRLNTAVTPYRCGASLAAFVALGRQKGYGLVGVHALGFNAIFVRDGVAEPLVPERSPQDLYAENPRLRQITSTHLEMILTGPGPERWEEV